MLNRRLGAKVRVLVVWEAILPTDWARPGSTALTRIVDARARQYWDPGHIVAGELRREIDADPGAPRPKCCDTGANFWDLAALYPPGARWGDTLPRAVFSDGPVFYVRETLEQRLDAVLKLAGPGSAPEASKPDAFFPAVLHSRHANHRRVRTQL
jgi:hypothetical protein